VALPQIAGELAATIANGWIYVVGGHSVTGSGGALNTVYAARIGANGTLGAWASLTALPQARWDLGVVAVNGFLWAIGGYNSAARPTNTVYRAPLNASNGTIGAWVALTALPSGVAEHTLSTAQGFLFVAGSKIGASGSSRTIFTAAVTSFPALPASGPPLAAETANGAALQQSAAGAPSVTSSDTWTAYLDGGNHQAYNNAFTAVGPANAAKLALKWTAGTGGNVEANPAVAIVANAVPAACAGTAVPMVFFGSWNGDLYAVNATTGSLCWHTFLAKDTNPKPNSKCITSWGITSSATVATVSVKGVPTQLVYAGASDILFAVAATTGTILWHTPLAGLDVGKFSPAVIWSSPAYSLANDTIYTSTASFCDETQPKTGAVYALNPATGAIKAQVSLLPGNAPGAGVWGSPTVSSGLQTVFVATGNAYVAGQQACDPAQPHSCAVLALDWTTLAVTASWQVPANQFVADGDFGSTPTLFAGTSGALWLGVGNKNGWYYVLNAANLAGGLVWSRQFATGGGNPVKGILAPTAYYPGTVTNGAGKSCTGVLYLAAGMTTLNGKAVNGSISALCALTGQSLWQKGTAGLIWAAPALANGLVADQNGATLEVRDWSTGAVLFSHTISHNIQGEAAFANGRIYVGSTDHNLYAFGL
jgi:outer membrane protein assembly factor BamB